MINIHAKVDVVTIMKYSGTTNLKLNIHFNATILIIYIMIHVSVAIN